MYLMVEFPRVKANDKEYSIVYYEKVSSVSRSAARDAPPAEVSGFPFCVDAGWRRRFVRPDELRHREGPRPADGDGERDKISGGKTK